MSNKTYILNSEGEPEPCEDYSKWGAWFNVHKEERMLAESTDGKGGPGEIKIITIFLGLDHSFGKGAEPLLFETRVINGVHDGYIERFTTRQAALEGHDAAVKKVFGEFASYRPPEVTNEGA